RRAAVPGADRLLRSRPGRQWPPTVRPTSPFGKTSVNQRQRLSRCDQIPRDKKRKEEKGERRGFPVRPRTLPSPFSHVCSLGGGCRGIRATTKLDCSISHWTAHLFNFIPRPAPIFSV